MKVKYQVDKDDGQEVQPERIEEIVNLIGGNFVEEIKSSKYFTRIKGNNFSPYDLGYFTSEVHKAVEKRKALYENVHSNYDDYKKAVYANCAKALQMMTDFSDSFLKLCRQIERG